jgi:hypothetical protein
MRKAWASPWEFRKISTKLKGRNPRREISGPGPVTVAALPPAWLFRIRVFCSRGSLTPVAAPNVSPNVFLSRGPGGEKRFRIRVLKDVA